MTDLQGKVILISGAAQGIGAAHAQVFVAAGAHVALGDIQDDAARALTERLGDAATFVHLDVTSPEDWEAAVTHTVAKFGRLDALINCAGIAAVASIEGTSPKLILDVLNVNTVGTLLGMQAAARVMEAGGVIVNLGSVDALHGVRGLGTYACSKAAVRSLTKTAALEFAPRGISVLCLHPGGVDTPMLHDQGNALMEFLGVPPEDVDIEAALKAAIPLGRVAAPDEIAEWSAFLIAKGGAVATGSEYVIDGGYTAGGGTGM